MNLVEFILAIARKPTYPWLQPKTLTPATSPELGSAVGVWGKTGPAEIHLMPLHWPDGAVSALGSDVGVGLGVGVAGTCVGTIGEGEGGAPVVGEGEAVATLQLATKHPATSPISSPLSGRTRARW